MPTTHRLARVHESVIREMTRLALAHDAINLSQGYPDFDTPPALVEAAVAAMRDGANQYTITWGHPSLRARLAEMYTHRLGWQVDPDRHVVVTCGVTEAIAATVFALLEPGDQIILLDPSHEMLRPVSVFAGAEPVS
ncbi:MAG: aminotransferase class I/II-fold pyridoxal phosphate-dependent enzyme, partial [Caldilineales bacterium]|nr:aminotransferase class I/II-fold pyridoxal phosphate-dependent enzyme [Caldilineales bacterium]